MTLPDTEISKKDFSDKLKTNMCELINELSDTGYISEYLNKCLINNKDSIAYRNSLLVNEILEDTKNLITNTFYEHDHGASVSIQLLESLKTILSKEHTASYVIYNLAKEIGELESTVKTLEAENQALKNR